MHSLTRIAETHAAIFHGRRKKALKWARQATRGSFRRAKYMTGARKAVAGTPATLGRFRRNQLLMGLGVGRWQLEG